MKAPVKILFAILLLCAPGLLLAQTPLPQATATPYADPTLESPRETLRTFIGAMKQFQKGRGDKLIDALKTMRLGEIPELAREAQGKELAIKLFGIINRTSKISYLKIPDRKLGAPFVFREDSDGVVSIENYEGNWQFSETTVRNIRDLFRAIENQPLLGSDTDAQSASLFVRASVPASLKHKFLFLEYWQWLGLLLAVIIFFPLRGISLVCFRQLAWQISKRQSEYSSSANLILMVPAGTYYALSWVFEGMIGVMDLPTGLYSTLLTLLRLLRILSLLVVIYFSIEIVAERLALRAHSAGRSAYALISPLIRRIGEVLVYIAGVFLVAQLFEFNISGLLAGLGLGGLAFALAAKDTVENLFGSLTVLIDRPFAVGDNIVIEGIEGVVERVGLRSTRIRTVQNSLVSFPNSKLISSAVDNLGARKFWRIKSNIVMVHGTPAVRVQTFIEAIKEFVKADSFIKTEEAPIIVSQISIHGIELTLSLLSQVRAASSELKERDRVFRFILQLADTLKIKLTSAFPVAESGLAGNEAEVRELALELARKSAHVQGASNV